MAFARKCLKVFAHSSGIAALILLAVSSFLTSCSIPGMVSTSGDGGTLVLSIDQPPAVRTLLPPLDMAIASYAVSGTGPSGATFATTSTQATLTINSLAFGQWTVSVSARNAAGTAIAQGSGSVAVATGQTSSLSVQVAPIPGNGSLHLAVTWTAAKVNVPSLSGQLLPVTGSPIPLTFTMGSGSATSDASGIPAGYYTLTLQLMDNKIVIMGAVDVVRILQGQTTSGTFDFTASNQPGGAIAVSIVPVMSDPLTVGLTGQKASIAVGGSMTVTAAVTGYTGNVTYVWNMNGQSIATGSTASPSLTLGSTMASGIYRLDVTAFSADGLRAGSATTGFTVQ
jgi:hypothetical protein